MATETLADAQHHRRRADAFRRLAIDIERTPAMRLHEHADVDTWRGSLPARCLGELRHAQHHLHVEADRLRSVAWWLVQRAEEIERRAAIDGMVW